MLFFSLFPSPLLIKKESIFTSLRAFKVLCIIHWAIASCCPFTINWDIPSVLFNFEGAVTDLVVTMSAIRLIRIPTKFTFWNKELRSLWQGSTDPASRGYKLPVAFHMTCISRPLSKLTWCLHTLIAIWNTCTKCPKRRCKSKEEGWKSVLIRQTDRTWSEWSSHFIVINTTMMKFKILKLLFKWKRHWYLSRDESKH